MALMPAVCGGRFCIYCIFSYLRALVWQYYCACFYVEYSWGDWHQSVYFRFYMCFQIVIVHFDNSACSFMDSPLDRDLLSGMPIKNLVSERFLFCFWVVYVWRLDFRKYFGLISCCQGFLVLWGILLLLLYKMQKFGWCLAKSFLWFHWIFPGHS